MVYSTEEIELTLNFYSIAKLHIDNLNQAIQFVKPQTLPIIKSNKTAN